MENSPGAIHPAYTPHPHIAQHFVKKNFDWLSRSIVPQQNVQFPQKVQRDSTVPNWTEMSQIGYKSSQLEDISSVRLLSLISYQSSFTNSFSFRVRNLKKNQPEFENFNYLFYDNSKSVKFHLIISAYAKYIFFLSYWSLVFSFLNWLVIVDSVNLFWPYEISAMSWNMLIILFLVLIYCRRKIAGQNILK